MGGFYKGCCWKKKQEIFMNGGEPTKQGGGQFLSTDVNGDLQNRGKILKIKWIYIEPGLTVVGWIRSEHDVSSSFNHHAKR